jgi:hypothetical protein
LNKLRLSQKISDQRNVLLSIRDVNHIIIIALASIFFSTLYYYNDVLGSYDFIAFWVGGTVTLLGQDPYDTTTLYNAYDFLNLTSHKKQIFWSPPWTLTPLLPFLINKFEYSYTLWFVFSVLCSASIFYSYGKLLITSFSFKVPPEKIIAYWAIFIISFHPLWFHLAMGQLTTLVLTAFLFFVAFSCRFTENEYSRLCSSFLKETERHRKISKFIAGISLSLTLIKPHLLYLVYFGVVVHAFKKNDFVILASLLFGFLLLVIAPYCINHDIYFNFLYARKLPVIFFNPTLGSWIQSFNPSIGFLRFIPAFIGCGVTFFLLTSSSSPYAVNKHVFYSPKTLTLLLSLSMITSPYYWNYDFIVLLPCVQLIMYTAWEKYSSTISKVLFFGLFSSNLLLILGPGDMRYYVWYPVIIFLLLLVALRVNKKIDTQQTIQSFERAA